MGRPGPRLPGKVVQQEGAPVGITTSAICPAYVRTPLVEAQIASQAEAHGLLAYGNANRGSGTNR